jgi:hypothetical protein
MMGIFFTKYVVGVLLAMHPELATRCRSQSESARSTAFSPVSSRSRNRLPPGGSADRATLAI